MLQFLCKFAFYQLYRLSNRTPKITRILKITCHTHVTLPVNMAPFSKEDKILIKNVHECKGYNPPQFITEFPDKGWTNNSIHLSYSTPSRVSTEMGDRSWVPVLTQLLHSSASASVKLNSTHSSASASI